MPLTRSLALNRSALSLHTTDETLHVVCAGRQLEFTVAEQSDGSVQFSHDAVPYGDYYLQVRARFQLNQCSAFFYACFLDGRLMFGVLILTCVQITMDGEAVADSPYLVVVRRVSFPSELGLVASASMSLSIVCLR